jgi:hypothetical protein
MDRLISIFGRWLGLGALALVTASAPAARAESIVTLCTQEELQARIDEARDLSGDGLVTFECDGVILLTNTIVLPFSLIEIEDDGYGGSVTNETPLLPSLTLDGTGRFITLSGLTATNASNGVRLFLVDSGVTLALTNIHLINGQSTNGGAIYVRTNGTLLASGCVFSNNLAVTSHGVDGASAPADTVNGTAKDGQGGTSAAPAAGGAIYNLGFAEFVQCAFLTNGVVAGSGGSGGGGGNATIRAGDGGKGGKGGSGLGGAVYNQGMLAAYSSSFYFNYAFGGSGGDGGAAGSAPFGGLAGSGGSGGSTAGAAIYNHLKSFNTIVNSTFAFNTAASGNSANAGSNIGRGKSGPAGPNSSGGAVANLGTNALINCTFFANEVTAGRGGNGADSSVQGGKGGSGGAAYGGNVFNGGKRALMLATNCTFSDGGAIPGTNGVAGSGPFAGKDGAKGSSRGANVANSNGVFHLKNNLIAYPSQGTNGYGKFKDAGYNFSSDRSIKLNRNLGSITNADPLLDILRPNGGPVETMELLTGSRAIDAGDTNFALPTDARGVSRPLNMRGDIGAYESGVILGPPRITTQPVSQIAREGATIIFSIVAQGDAPLLYQWRKNDVDIPGETSASLMLSLVDDSDQGSYDVEVSNNSGTITSEAATLDIVHAPEITDDLADDSIDFGEQLVLSVTATGDEPLAYTWLTNGVVALGATLDTFTINNATNKDDMDYQVIVCNTYGCATSSVAHVTVQSPTAPEIQTEPVGADLFSGETATFTVGHTGSAPLSYQWLLNGIALPGAVSHPLVITNAQSSNAGSYRLIIANSLGSVTSAPAVLTISNSAPVITMQPTPLVVALDTEVVVLSVTAIGSKPMTFQWYRTILDNMGLPVGGYVAVTGGTNSTLTLPVTAPGNETDREGQYQAIITNDFGSMPSDEVFVDIIGYGFGN